MNFMSRHLFFSLIWNINSLIMTSMSSSSITSSYIYVFYTLNVSKISTLLWLFIKSRRRLSCFPLVEAFACYTILADNWRRFVLPYFLASTAGISTPFFFVCVCHTRVYIVKKIRSIFILVRNSSSKNHHSPLYSCLRVTEFRSFQKALNSLRNPLPHIRDGMASMRFVLERNSRQPQILDDVNDKKWEIFHTVEFPQSKFFRECTKNSFIPAMSTAYFLPPIQAS